MPKMGMRDVRREQICQATASVIATRGFDRTTLREVADVAGVSTGTVNHYFANKLDLLVATLAYTSERFMAQVMEAVAAEPPGLPRLEAYVRISLDGVEGDAIGWKVWIAAWSEATRSHQAREVIQRRRQVTYGLFREVLIEIDPGLAAADPALDTISREFEAFVSGLGLNMVTGVRYLDREAAEEAAMLFVKERIRQWSESVKGLGALDREPVPGH